MSLRALLLVVVVTSAGCVADAQEAPPPPAKLQLKGAEWVAAMKGALPQALCEPQQYFRQCFEVTKDACLAQATKESEACLAKYADKLPAVFNQPEDGTEWGAVVGRCAGVAYEKALLGKRKKDPRCDDAKNWVP